MVTSLKFEPAADFSDPRLERDFQPAHWPLCNGKPVAPPSATDLHERRCLEFLASYYRLNVLNDRLLAARSDGQTETADGLLKNIVTAMSGLEALEDRYAPVGFFGEPVVDGVFYRNIVFVRPALPRPAPPPVQASSHIAIPGWDRLPEPERQGTVNVIRWRYGKMDL